MTTGIDEEAHQSCLLITPTKTQHDQYRNNGKLQCIVLKTKRIDVHVYAFRHELGPFHKCKNSSEDFKIIRSNLHAIAKCLHNARQQ
jgi:hypothetical protein